MNQYEKEMYDLYKKSIGEKQDFKGIVCPRIYKKPCRLCDLCLEVLFDRSIPKKAPLREKASSLNAKQHYFSNILFLADPTQVVVFEYGDKVFKQLLAMQMDPEQGFQDFWHPISGRWLVIERIQGATREQVDYYVKPKDPSKLSDMSVLSKMYDLGKITELTSQDKVKPIYQSKLDKITVIRFLPSWLGPDFAMKFFSKVDFHYNISEEDFKACQAGEINPIRIGGEQETKREDNPDARGWGTPATPPLDKTQSSAPKRNDPWAVDWERQEKMPAAKKTEPEADEDELPPCYGDYDPDEGDCTEGCSDWREGCKAYRDEKIAKRKAAKRLSK